MFIDFIDNRERGRTTGAVHRQVSSIGFEANGILKMSIQDIFYRPKPHLQRNVHAGTPLH